MKKLLAVLLCCSATVGLAQAVKVTPKHVESFAYPVAARANRIGGTVKLRLTIGRDGSVKSVEKVSGHPMLSTAAEENVRTWLFPAKKHEATLNVIYEFSLPDSATKPNTEPLTKVFFDLPDKVRVVSAGPYVEAIE